MARMLMLYFKIKDDESSQGLAKFVKNGFRYESWKALQGSGTVYEARITALEHPDDPSKLSSILLSTTYDGAPLPYQKFFWNELTPFFVLVALAAKDNPPFTLADLIPEQLTALKAAQLAIKSCEEAKDQTEFEQTQAAFRDATKALAAAMAIDEQRQRDKVIAKTKFELFTEWVNRNDLTFHVGSPPAPGASVTHDLREPPQLSERSNFINPALAAGPFPLQ